MIEILPAPPREPPWREFARAPMAPAALAAAAGLALERFTSLPLEAEFAVAIIGLLAWLVRRTSAAIPVAVFGLAAAHLHIQRHIYAPDDIGEWAAEAPAIVTVRGFLDETPTVRAANRSELFGPARRADRATTVLSITSVEDTPASGRLRLVVEREIASHEPGVLDALHIGDEVEVVGLLSKPSTPGNPGERDYADWMLNQRLRAELRVVKGADGVTRLNEAAGLSWSRLLASLRARCTALLRETLPTDDQPLARALLLGDTAATGQDDWDAFARTGVIHVLAISGQHLVILAGAVWLLLRILDVPRRRGAVAVLVLIIAYAALTGGRPSANRAAVMVTILSGGVILRRPVSLANAFCCAWLVVVALDPAEAISMGSQLSFISVFALIWCAARWVAEPEITPVQQLIRESRPAWQNDLRWLGRAFLALYAVNAILFATNSPLVMWQMNMISPIGLLIGPPVVILTTIALLSGFLLLLAGLISSSLAMPFAAVTGWTLSVSKNIVHLADTMPGGVVFVPDVAGWWVAGFYLLLTVLVLNRFRTRYALALTAWSFLGLVGVPDRSSDELRMTFLSVGHGGCTVIETPDGRVLLYDAGTMAGPDAVKRIVAPFLWRRGVRRIDELFLSHADLDHYNGVAELLRRFPVGQVTLTPSFAEKPVPEVAEVLLILEKHNVPRRIAAAGDSFTAGDVTFEVLHPPHDGPAASENERSLVLKVRHGGHAMLLTGDLEKTGLTMLLSQLPQPVDVLMAPHHGSPAALPAALMQWSQPKLVLVSRGQRATHLVNAPDAWDTWTHGAITLHSHVTGLTAETFRTKQRVVLKRGK